VAVFGRILSPSRYCSHVKVDFDSISFSTFATADSNATFMTFNSLFIRGFTTCQLGLWVRVRVRLSFYSRLDYLPHFVLEVMLSPFF